MSGYGVIQSVQKRRMEYEMRLENSQSNEQPSRPSEASYGPGVVTAIRPSNTGDNKRNTGNSNCNTGNSKCNTPDRKGLRQMQGKTGFWSSCPEWADYLIDAIMSAARNFFYGPGMGHTEANVALNNLAATGLARKNKSQRPLSIAKNQRRPF